MKKDLNSIMLTRQELQIMKVVWDKGTATVKDVLYVLYQKKPVAYTTILTLMGILEQKGALAHKRSGRAFIYKPLLSRERATQNQVHDLINRFFDGRPEKLIESILDNHIGALRQPEAAESLPASESSNHVA
jgi:BlaI family penicillinase repressor